MTFYIAPEVLMGNLDATSLRQVYDRARSFLLKQIPDDNAAAILDHYLTAEDGSRSAIPLEGLYQRLLFSAQNANMKAGVIGGSIDGIEKLSAVLYSFNPASVIAVYGEDADLLLNTIVERLKPRGKIRLTPQSLWPKYCQTILSAAKFFCQFASGKEFYAWANHFYPDTRSRAALPMILAEEIFGIGYPLACDFLKELGFVNYGKPDVHIKDIFIGTHLCNSKTTDYEYQKVIGQIAEANNVSAYNVDKLFWLVGSGRFYDNPELGRQGNIGRGKERFLAEFAR